MKIQFLNHIEYSFILLVILGLSHTPARAEPVQCLVYGINLQGTATVGDADFTSGSQPFSINQYAIFRLKGLANNPVEVVFETLQDLNASPQIGQLHLMSNSAFARNPGIASAQFDLGKVGFSENNGLLVVNFEVDSGMSFQLPPPNVFVSPGAGTVPGGLGGLGFLSGAGGQLADFINGASILQVNYFVPRNGGGFVFSPDGTWSTIVGKVELVGSGPDNASNQGQYTATISGNYLGAIDCG